MENLKDMQIKAQAETIESLERKIESLEKKLHKCLPDSGEYKPEWKQPKHGEVALQKITFEGPDELTHIDARLKSIVIGAFRPVEIWMGTGKSRSKMVLQTYHSWGYFRNALFDVEEFDSYWQNKDFRKAVDHINLALDRLGDLDDINCNDESTRSAFDTIAVGFLDDLEYLPEMEIGVSLLLEAAKTLPSIKDISERMDEGELYEVIFGLETISFCQKLWKGIEREKVNQE